MRLYNYEDFLVAVVNAHDHAPRPGLRKRFMSRYRNWFPGGLKDEEDAQRAFKAIHYLEKKGQLWWCEPRNIDTMLEQPNPDITLNIEILRDKLRYVWGHSRDKAMLRNRLYEFRVAILAYQKLRNEHDKGWRHRFEGALCWLGENIHRTFTCQNPECDGEERWKFREKNNQKYCSEECAQRGRELKRVERQKKLPPKQYKKSAETRRKMALSAEKRWRGEKQKKKQPKRQELAD